MRLPLRTLALVSALGLAVAGCSGGEVRRPAASSAPAAPTAPFVYAFNLDVITNWDPATSSSNEIIALQNVYETLTKYNPETRKAEPRLAVSWTASPDGRGWTFKLREGAKFHTGKPVDAAAVKASIERTRKMAGYAAYIWDSVKAIQVVNPTTVRFSLSYPAPLDLIASAGYGAYVYDTTAAGRGDLKAWFAEGRDAGSGPYTVGTWEKGRETELTLKAFDDYWGGWKDPGHYRDVRFRVTPEETTAWQLLKRGEVGFMERVSPQLFAQAPADGVQTSETSSFQNLLVLFNTESTDVRVRRAVQKAIDYQGLVTAAKGSIVLGGGLVPEGLLGHVPGDPPAQDLAGAEALLREAGYGPGGRELTLRMTFAQGDSDQQLLTTLLGSALSKLNVKLEAAPLQWSAQWDQGKAKDPSKRQDIFVMYWFPDYADAYSWFNNVFRSAENVEFNLSYLKDPAVDAKIDTLPELTATDRAAAEKAYGELQATLIDERAAVAVPYVQRYRRAYLGGVQGYVDNPAYPNVVFFHDLRAGR
ncbi:ABC transporter substrate-binding protein [Rhizohabitans arisaemae]|uniref:ABC transporter substrate-binding protein n=1 Tax=Rhizohabitans arisaemae TaxID=2720610 RepID=UPI0024B18D99|nr:ABC transporter substrate-binding protein [Rhizohabitans arisaemae]